MSSEIKPMLILVKGQESIYEFNIMLEITLYNISLKSSSIEKKRER